MSLNLQIGNNYTFNTYAPSIIGAVVTKATLLAILSFDLAIKFDNVELKYQQILPALPPGAPLSASSVVYYMFQTANGPIVIADPWIDGTSLVGSPTKAFTINVTQASDADRSNVVAALTRLGVNFSITDTVSSS
jgi:hypothetical protein